MASARLSANNELQKRGNNIKKLRWGKCVAIESVQEFWFEVQSNVKYDVEVATGKFNFR